MNWAARSLIWVAVALALTVVYHFGTDVIGWFIGDGLQDGKLVRDFVGMFAVAMAIGRTADKITGKTR